MRLIFYLPKFYFIFSKINVIPFKIVSLGSYTPMETLFPLLVAALEVFNWYGLQHVCCNRKKQVFDLLDRFANEQSFFIRVITGDESWIFNTILRPRGKVRRGTL
jgi:hypothetical protein